MPRNDAARAREHYLIALSLAGGPAPLRERATQTLTALQPAGADAGWLDAELARRRDERRAAALKSMVDRPLPKLTLTTVDGKPFDASILKGKVVLLDFFASWCGACRAELPHLKAAFAKYQNDPDVVFLFVSIDEDSKRLQRYLNEMKFPFRVARIDATHAEQTMGFDNVPQTFYLDRGGVVRYQTTGGESHGDSLSRVGWYIDQLKRSAQLKESGVGPGLQVRPLGRLYSRAARLAVAAVVAVTASACRREAPPAEQQPPSIAAAAPSRIARLPSFLPSRENRGRFASPPSATRAAATRRSTKSRRRCRPTARCSPTTSSSCSATTSTTAARPSSTASGSSCRTSRCSTTGVKFYATIGNHDDPNQPFYPPFNMGGERYYTFKPPSLLTPRARHRRRRAVLHDRHRAARPAAARVARSRDGAVGVGVEDSGLPSADLHLGPLRAPGAASSRARSSRCS